MATLVFDKYFARLCGDYPVCRLICEEINDLGPDIINNIEEISICNAFTVNLKYLFLIDVLPLICAGSHRSNGPKHFGVQSKRNGSNAGNIKGKPILV